MYINKLTIQLIADIFFAANFLLDSQDKLCSTKKYYDKIFPNATDNPKENAQDIFPILIFVSVLLQVFASIGLFLYENKEIKRVCALILSIILIIFDMCLCHFPNLVKKIANNKEDHVQSVL